MIIYYSLGKLTVMYVMNDLKVYPESNSVYKTINYGDVFFVSMNF